MSARIKTTGAGAVNQDSDDAGAAHLFSDGESGGACFGRHDRGRSDFLEGEFGVGVQVLVKRNKITAGGRRRSRGDGEGGAGSGQQRGCDKQI